MSAPQKDTSFISYLVIVRYGSYQKGKILGSFLLFDSFQNDELVSQHPPKMTNEFMLFFLSIIVNSSNTLQSNAVTILIDAQLSHLASCPITAVLHLFGHDLQSSRASRLLLHMSCLRPGIGCLCPEPRFHGRGGV